MAFKVIISDEAKLDLENSYLYYRENASKKVADNFYIIKHNYEVRKEHKRLFKREKKRNKRRRRRR